MTLTNRFALLLPVWFLFVLGCGGTKSAAARLSGSVKYNGAPVTAGTITFMAKGEGAEGGPTYLATIEPNGTYLTSQLPAGDFTVTIETESANPNRAKQTYGSKGKMTSSPMPDDVKSSAPTTGPYVKIPAKYADSKKSGLTVNLTSGRNVKDFDLTD